MGKLSTWITKLKSRVERWWAAIIGGTEASDAPPQRPDDDRPRPAAGSPHPRVAPLPLVIPPDVARILDPYLGVILALIESGDCSS